MTILAGVLLTYAAIGQPQRGDHEYVLWAIGHGHLIPRHANPPLSRTNLPQRSDLPWTLPHPQPTDE